MNKTLQARPALLSTFRGHRQRGQQRQAGPMLLAKQTVTLVHVSGRTALAQPASTTCTAGIRTPNAQLHHGRRRREVPVIGVAMTTGARRAPHFVPVFSSDATRPQRPRKQPTWGTSSCVALACLGCSTHDCTLHVNVLTDNGPVGLPQRPTRRPGGAIARPSSAGLQIALRRVPIVVNGRLVQSATTSDRKRTQKLHSTIIRLQRLLQQLPLPLVDCTPQTLTASCSVVATTWETRCPESVNTSTATPQSPPANRTCNGIAQNRSTTQPIGCFQQPHLHSLHTGGVDAVYRQQTVTYLDRALITPQLLRYQRHHRSSRRSAIRNTLPSQQPHKRQQSTTVAACESTRKGSARKRYAPPPRRSRSRSRRQRPGTLGQHAWLACAQRAPSQRVPQSPAFATSCSSTTRCGPAPASAEGQKQAQPHQLDR